MPGCEGVVDLEQAALCHSHSQVGNQSLDTPLQPPVAPFAPATLVLALDVAHAASASLSPSPAPDPGNRALACDRALLLSNLTLQTLRSGPPHSARGTVLCRLESAYPSISAVSGRCARLAPP
jgi:hypothetical protein